jgi:hypothetical protein
MAEEHNNSIFCFADTKDVQLKLADINTDELPDDAQIPIEIPIFREGNFEHPFYDDTNFDADYLNEIVENHKRGVLPRGVAFDLDHRRYGGGAVAWLREDVANPLEVRTVKVPQPTGGDRSLKVLFAKVNLTRRGAQLVKSREYRYFSSEIHPDYTTREVIELGKKDKGVVRHGPTLLGGGLTNQPFIPGLGEFVFSEDGEPQGDGACVLMDRESGIHLFSCPEDGGEPSSSEPEPSSTEPEQAPVAASSETDEHKQQFGDNQMDKLFQQYANADSNEQRLAILEAAALEFAADETKLATVKLLKSQTENAIAQEQAFNQVVADAARHEANAQKYAEENKNLKVQAAKAGEQAYTSSVKLFCEELRNDKHHEPVVAEVERVLLNSEVKTRDAAFKFDADSEETVDLMGVIKQIFSALPESARLDFSESMRTKEDELNGNEPAVETKPEGGTTEFNTDGDPEGDDDDAAQAELDRRIALYEAIYEEKPKPGLYEYINKDGSLNPTPVKE